MNKKALYNITYGLYLLSVCHEGRDNACIINTAVQVANDPVRIAISVIRQNHTCDLLLQTGEFNLSALSTDAPFSLFKHFGMQSGREVDKFQSFTDVTRSGNGLYYLTQYANAYLSAKVVERMDLGSHMLFIAEVTDGEVLAQTPCCTYGYYQSDIKPKPAPIQKKGWVCSVCGYVHEGDLPDDFLCPLCSHGKEDFRPVGQDQPETAPKTWVCGVCGQIWEGENPPDVCPLCKQPGNRFKQIK